MRGPKLCCRKCDCILNLGNCELDQVNRALVWDCR